MNTLYVKCMCGRNRLLVNKYKALGYAIKVTSKSREWRDDSKILKSKLPFIITNGKVQEL